jgi:hypothetical protein
MIIQCPKCNTPFDNYSKWGNKKFCSRSCGNSHAITDKHKTKLLATIANKSTIKNQYGEHVRRPYQEQDGLHTRIYLCTCKYSGKQWYSKTVKTVHPDLTRTKGEYSYSCRFRFGISSYPNWFTSASELITKHGWYSTPGSRKGIKNTNGISRDHVYSITDGWLNNIPPAIIRHPANCELIQHTENQSKHKKSKITIEELYQRIKQFNLIYGDPPEN